MNFYDLKNKLKNNKVSITVFLLVSLLFSCSSVAVFSNYAANKEKIKSNIYVLEESVKNLTTKEAIELIENKYKNSYKDQKLMVAFRGKEYEILLDDCNVKLNSIGTIEKITEQIKKQNILLNVINFLGINTEKIQLTLSVDYNKEKLNTILDQIINGAEILPIEWFYKLDQNKLRIETGKNGFGVNREAFFKKFEDQLSCLEFSAILIEKETLFCKEIDKKSLYEELTSGPINAKYEKNNGKIVIIPEKNKIIITPEEIEKLLSQKQEIYVKHVDVEEAEITKEILKERLFKDTLSSFTTKFNPNLKERSQNIKLSALRCNDYALLPGEVFSFDKTIGPRTIENGYKPSKVYVGNTLKVGIGGGICQTSSTIYSSGLYSGLEIVERHCHSLPVSYVTTGQDATIAEDYLDLKIKNNSNYPVKITIDTSKINEITVSFIGTKEQKDLKVFVDHSVEEVIPYNTIIKTDDNLPSGVTKIIRQGQNGFKVRSIRTFKKNEEIIKTEHLTSSTYHPIDAIKIVGTKEIIGPKLPICQSGTEASDSPNNSFANYAPKDSSTKDPIELNPNLPELTKTEEISENLISQQTENPDEILINEETNEN